MKKRKIPGRTRRERARYFAFGRVTTGTVSTFTKSTHTFRDWFVGKVRGCIVMNNRRQWKFTTKEAARKAAETYRAHARREGDIA